MEIVRLRERHSAPEVTAAKLVQAERLAGEWQRLVRRLVEKLWAANHLADVVPAKGAFAVQKRRRMAGQYAESSLNTHYQNTAIVKACAIVRGGWEQTFTVIRHHAVKFSESERHEINWLLRWPTHLQTILDGGVVSPEVDKLASNNHAAIARWLRLMLHKHHPNRPRMRGRLAFELDSSHYRLSQRKGAFKVWIAVTGLTKSKRIRIPLRGDDIAHLDGTANLRCSIETDAKGRRRVVFRAAERIEVQPREGQAAGLDKGIVNVITLTTGTPEEAKSYGLDYATALTLASEGLVQRNRSRLRALSRSAGATRARNLRRHNLGNKKHLKRERRARVELRRLHNTAINQALRDNPGVAQLALEDLSFIQSSNRGRAGNRRLGRWAKGQLQRDLVRISEANGVGLQVVNAAYTSKACPRCDWTDGRNRSGQVFRCTYCGYREAADAVAASNVLQRANDPEITRYTPYQSVKQILLQRHAARMVGSYPGEQTIRPVTVVPVTDSA